MEQIQTARIEMGRWGILGVGLLGWGPRERERERRCGFVIRIFCSTYFILFDLTASISLSFIF
ncbi:hypothetical protein LINPERHAP1_LOCUS8215, partial [Linum perenne]